MSTPPSTASGSIPFFTKSGNTRAMMDGATMRCVQATGRPPASSPARSRWTLTGRYWSCWVSSSRDQITFTGAPTAFEVSSASWMKSSSNRRPKPPPRYVVWTFTFSGGTPPILAPRPCAPDWNWVGAQMSTPSARTCAAALIGSIVACARNGNWYVASRFVAAAARAASGSPPSWRATAPGWSARCASSCEMPALVSCAFGPSSQVISSASRPFFAGQYPSATTATPEEIWTTWRTPGTAFAFVASKLATLPPMAGQRATTATLAVWRNSRRVTRVADGALMSRSLRRAMDRGADALVGAAAADVRHRRVDVGVRRVRGLRQQCGGGHDLARLAVAALRHVLRDPRLLHRMCAVPGKSFDGGHALSGDGRDRQHAGAGCDAVQVHGASAALRDTAPELRAREAEVVAQHPEERGVGCDVDRFAFSVDGEADGRHERRPLRGNSEQRAPGGPGMEGGRARFRERFVMALSAARQFRQTVGPGSRFRGQSLRRRGAETSRPLVECGASR